MSESEHAVVIAGGGPTGLMMAGELALAGVDTLIVERRTTQDLTGTRAGGLHSRTIEVLDQRGIADRFLSEGEVAQAAGFAWIPLDISDLPTRHPYVLALKQVHIERILAGWVDELAVPVLRGRVVIGFAEDDAGVDVELSDGGTLRAKYFVGCDGGRSVVRKAAGIDFPGWDATISHLIAEVQMADEPEWGLRRDARGTHGLTKLDGGGVRVMLTEASPGATSEPTLGFERGAGRRVRDRLRRSQPDLAVALHRCRSAGGVVPRRSRVLLAGDAAHIHYQVGPWELPALGPVSAPTAVLVRPDGYVAWVGEGNDTGLTDALTTWFGDPQR